MLGIWQLAEAETVGTANVLFARHPSGAVHRLMADSDWRLIGFSGIGNASSRWLPGTARGEATPANATNPPAPGGVTVPLDVVGSVSLRHDLSGQLYANTTLLTRDGEPVSLGGLADLRPVAAETFTTGQHLLLRSPANDLIIWNFGNNWTYVDADPPVAADSITGLGLLSLFGVRVDNVSS